MEYAIERFLDKLELEAREDEREKARKKEREDKIKTAKTALLKNIPKEIVAEITGIDIKEVEVLEKEIAH